MKPGCGIALCPIYLVKLVQYLDYADNGLLADISTVLLHYSFSLSIYEFLYVLSSYPIEGGGLGVLESLLGM
jgi:hypothetical protein